MIRNPYSLAWILVCLYLPMQLCAQTNNGGSISGNLQANGNFFIEDEQIGAANTPQYDHQLFGAESWLGLQYSNWGFDFGLRFDLYNNSNLLNPQGSYTDQGIGRWYIRKQIDDLEISVGYLYDQIGSGIIFRAYESRPLAIDNALAGVRLTYDIGDYWTVKAFTGRQKNQFDLYESVLKGGSIEGFISIGEERPVNLAPGIGLVHKTLADQTMDDLIATLQTYTPQDSIGAKYNTFAFSIYNTLSVGALSWYVEGAYKTDEVLFDPMAVKSNFDGTTSLGKYINKPGYVLYNSLSWAAGGWGVTIEHKWTEEFRFRTNPFVTLNRGMINFLPPMAQQNTYRLTARYNPATQELGSQAVQLDLRYAPSRKWNFQLNGSNITDLDNELLYRELYAQFQFKKRGTSNWKLTGGLQMQAYNQNVYEMKPESGLVQNVVPFADWLYKFDRRTSLRLEAQYMKTGVEWSESTDKKYRDFGDWIYVLAEFGLAPKWIFSVSDMYNVDPTKTDDLHYISANVVYTQGPNRFSLGYVKQVEGVVCTGGICRLEPAFSGFKLSVNSSF